MKEFSENNIILEFYKKPENTHLSFRVKDNPVLTDKLRSLCKKKTVKQKDIKFAVPGLFKKINDCEKVCLFEVTNYSSPVPMFSSYSFEETKKFCDESPYVHFWNTLNDKWVVIIDKKITICAKTFFNFKEYLKELEHIEDYENLQFLKKKGLV